MENQNSTQNQSCSKSQCIKTALFVAGGVILGALGGWFIATKCCSSKGDTEVVAKVNGRAVTSTEVFGPIKTRLFDIEEELYRNKKRAIDDYIETALLDAEAKKNNVSVPQLLEKELGQEAKDVTDKEIEEFLISKGLSLNDPRIRKEDVKEYLKFRNQHEKRKEYVAKLTKTANVQVYLREPESVKLNVSVAGYPTWGNAHAPVTIIEFSDFQCPFCARAVASLEEVKKNYGPDKVKIVFRDMPLPNHPRALPAANAALCANEQGKFWEFHNALFQNQQKLEDKDFVSHVKTLGIDEKKFNECYSGKKHQGLIDASIREAQSAGISATPSFLINGSLLQGAQPYERFKEKIDKELGIKG